MLLIEIVQTIIIPKFGANKCEIEWKSNLGIVLKSLNAIVLPSICLPITVSGCGSKRIGSHAALKKRANSVVLAENIIRQFFEIVKVKLKHLTKKQPHPKIIGELLNLLTDLASQLLILL